MKMCDCNQGRLPCGCKAESGVILPIAEQHQGEPVATVQTVDPLVLTTGALHTLKVGDKLYTHPGSGEVDVRKVLLDAIPGDGDGLEIYAKSVDEVVAVLGRQADEVERLRVELREQREIFGIQEDKIDTLRAKAGQHKLAMDAAHGEIEILRAQLAERDALLRTARKPLELRAEYDPTYPGNSMPRNDCAEALTAIDAALSASPEPRGALQFPGCAYADFNTAGYMPAGQAEKFSKSLLAHLGTNEEREPLSAEELGQARKRLEDAMRPLNADAPVEIDERAEFEADWAHRMKVAGHRERANAFYRIQPNDRYRWNDVQDAWEAWQASAALERKS